MHAACNAVDAGHPSSKIVRHNVLTGLTLTVTCIKAGMPSTAADTDCAGCTSQHGSGVTTVPGAGNQLSSCFWTGWPPAHPHCACNETLASRSWNSFRAMQNISCSKAGSCRIEYAGGLVNIQQNDSNAAHIQAKTSSHTSAGEVTGIGAMAWLGTIMASSRHLQVGHSCQQRSH